jgi:phosphoribosylaminoimidazole (AIR) synthetase
MYRVFNMGIGMVFVVPAGSGRRITMEDLRWKPLRIGTVVEGEPGVRLAGITGA